MFGHVICANTLYANVFFTQQNVTKVCAKCTELSVEKWDRAMGQLLSVRCKTLARRLEKRHITIKRASDQQR